MKKYHEPVLLKEVLEHLQIESNRNYIDGTLGAAGHAEKILEQNGPNGKVLGIDLDQQAIDIAQKNLEQFGQRAILQQGSYLEMKEFVESHDIDHVHGILLDLGLSSMQLDISGRGFSFRKEEPLNMRFDGNDSGLTAELIVNKFSEKELVQIFKEYGEERYAKKIANNICTFRKEERIITTQQLVELIAQSVPKSQLYRPTHYATKVFQALRIATNKEFEVIKDAIHEAMNVLELGGRLVVITFHSLEDKLVKNVFKDLAQSCVCPPDFPKCVCDKEAQIKIINKKVITPSDEEIDRNPRSRSAKLRVVEKI